MRSGPKAYVYVYTAQQITQNMQECDLDQCGYALHAWVIH